MSPLKLNRHPAFSVGMLRKRNSFFADQIKIWMTREGRLDTVRKIF